MSSWIDVVVVAGYMVAVLLVGLHIGRRSSTLDDYLLASRNLPWWALLGSIVATETSTVTFLSIPGLAYVPKGDFRFLQLALGFLLGRLVVAYLLIPLYFQGQIRTAYQALENHFGSQTKTAASLLFLITRNVADGIRLYLAALVVQVVTDWSLLQSVVAVGLITVIYTVYGGLRSVVWNDCLQLAVYLCGAVVAVVVIAGRLPGGWAQLLQFSRDHDKLTLFYFQWNYAEPYTLWSGLIGGAFLSLATHGADQLMVQRYLCARSQSEAAQAVALSGIVVFLQFALFLWLGVALASFYYYFPPPVPPKESDRVLAQFIVQEMPPGLRGLLLAAVFAAAMSTLSSSLNSSVASASEDLLRPWGLLRPTSETTQLQWARTLTLAFGLIQVTIALMAPLFAKRVIDSVLAIAAFTTGVVLGLFLLAAWNYQVRAGAALFGLSSAVFAMTLVAFVTPVAWPWYSVIGSLLTVTFVLVAAWICSRAGGKHAAP